MSKQKKTGKSALKVMDGVDQLPTINKNAIFGLGSKKKMMPLDFYFKGIRNGDISVLGRAITLIESNLFAHKQMAEKIIKACLPYSNNSIRIGITGVPGVGKSTLIESLGLHLCNQGKKLAVLAIDPSSGSTGGSILGDKTRMEKLSTHPAAFIRPSPSAGSLGGVARKTRETIILCEAAGFDTVFIETVGVGQSETSVKSMVDVFLLLMLSGAGDELQGIKRGIMEMADLLAITKADGENIQKAKNAAVDYKNALHLFPQKESKVIVDVLTCSSQTGEGLENVWSSIEKYIATTKSNGYFQKNRKEQAQFWMHETIRQKLESEFYENVTMNTFITKLEQSVLEGEISSFAAAEKLLEKFYKLKND